MQTRRFFRHTWQISLTTIILMCSVAVAQPTRISEFLSHETRIRVLIPSSPNFGHQISSLHFMERIRELGFQGRFEIVSSEGNRSKLETLIPPSHRLGDHKIIYYDPYNGFPKLDPVHLTITGGNDTALNDTWKSANSDILLQLQPMNWKNSKNLYQIGENTYPLDDLIGLSIPSSPIIKADPHTFFNSQLNANPKLRMKSAGLETLFLRVEEFELLPVYGLQMSINQRSTIASLIQGLKAVQKIEPGFWSKPILLPILTDDPTGRNESLNREFERQNVKQVRIDDPNLASAITQTQAGELLFIQVGQVPPDVFSYIYAQATQPGLLEGKNTAALALRLGKPYLQISSDLSDLENTGAPAFSESIRIRSEIEAAHWIFNQDLSQTALSPQARSAFYHFLKSLRDPQSTLSLFYTHFKGIGNTPGTDKVLIALNRMIDTLDCNGAFHGR